jgi:solute:Na+ symporter, SSS family
VMVFVFYQFNASPLNFNPKATEVVQNSKYASDFQELQTKHIDIENSKKQLLADGIQKHEVAEIQSLNEKDAILKEASKAIIDKINIENPLEKIESNDKDYVFIHFILNNLPKGLIGLLLAVILSAAMSSTASELNALASTTAMDLYKRSNKIEKSELHYVKASKWFTLLWGIISISVACVANLFDNLIQLVNIIGSIFYGNVLGIFLLAFFIKYVKGNAVFIAAIITQILIIIIWYLDYLPYLWLNLLGCVLVMLIAIFLQFFNNLKLGYANNQTYKMGNFRIGKNRS